MTDTNSKPQKAQPQSLNKEQIPKVNQSLHSQTLSQKQQNKVQPKVQTKQQPKEKQQAQVQHNQKQKEQQKQHKNQQQQKKEKESEKPQQKSQAIQKQKINEETASVKKVSNEQKKNEKESSQSKEEPIQKQKQKQTKQTHELPQPKAQIQKQSNQSQNKSNTKPQQLPQQNIETVKVLEKKDLSKEQKSDLKANKEKEQKEVKEKVIEKTKENPKQEIKPKEQKKEKAKEQTKVKPEQVLIKKEPKDSPKQNLNQSEKGSEEIKSKPISPPLQKDISVDSKDKESKQQKKVQEKTQKQSEKVENQSEKEENNSENENNASKVLGNSKQQEKSSEKAVQNDKPKTTVIKANDTNDNQSQQKQMEIKTQKQQSQKQQSSQPNKLALLFQKYFKSVLPPPKTKQNPLKISLIHQTSQPIQNTTNFNFQLIAGNQATENHLKQHFPQQNIHQAQSDSEFIIIQIFTNKPEQLEECIEAKIKEQTLPINKEQVQLKTKIEDDKINLIFKFPKSTRNHPLESILSILQINQNHYCNINLGILIGCKSNNKEKQEDKKVIENLLKGFNFELNISASDSILQNLRKNIETQNSNSKFFSLISIIKSSSFQLKWKKVEDFNSFFTKLGILQALQETPSIKQLLQDSISEVFESSAPSSLKISQILNSILKNFDSNKIQISRVINNCVVSLNLSGQNCKKLIS